MNRQNPTVRTIAFCSGIVLAALFHSTLAGSQTSDEMEKRLANLPPAERAYERFRFWISSQPPDRQRAADIDARYRAYLKDRGF